MRRPCDIDVAAGTTPPGSLLAALCRWRFRWLPYRTHQSLGDGRFTRPMWQWPEVLNKDLR